MSTNHSPPKPNLGPTARSSLRNIAPPNLSDGGTSFRRSSSSPLKNLSARELHEKLLGLVGEERKLTLTILEHLREVEARRLYAERGHSSLFEYCVSELRYSEAAAMRRISAMRALKVLPELKVQVESGELKVTQLAALQSFVRMEAKAGKTYSVPETRALFQAACGKSTRETEKLLAEKNPEYLNREKVRIVSATQTQLSFTADDALMQQIQAVRDRFAHQLPVGATLAEVVHFMAKTTLLSAPEKRCVGKRISKNRTPKEQVADEKTSKGRVDNEKIDKEKSTAYLSSKHPVAGAESAEISVGIGRIVSESIDSPASVAALKSAMESSAPTPVIRSRYIPIAVRRLVWTRDQGRCQFVSRVTGKKCLSRHRPQADHIVPFALGGSSTDSENLRLLCFSHNQCEARWVFGRNGTRRRDARGDASTVGTPLASTAMR